MNKIDVAYWNSQTGDLKVIGSAGNANGMGEIILKTFPDFEKALRQGIFYFRLTDSTFMPYYGNHVDFAKFLDFIYHQAELLPQPPHP